MTTQFLTEDISWDEAPNGEPVLKAYPDPLSKGPPWTIGFGSTGPDIVEGTVWTAEQCVARRDSVIANTIRSLSATQYWDHCNDARQDVLVNMAYQMGLKGLLGFTSTLAALLREAWDTVAADAELSKWRTQTPARAERLIQQLKTGVRVATTHDAAQVQPAPQTEPTLMSLATEFIFDPLKAAIARALGSSNPVTQQVAVAAASAVTSAQPQAVQTATQSSNSPAGLAMPEIGALEDDLNAAVAKFAANFISTDVPIVGALVAPEVQKAIIAGMTFGEQHASTYLAGLFQFHTAVATSPAKAS